MEKQLSLYRDHGFGLWAVVLKDTGAMIGQCGGLTIQEWKGADVLEVGYLFNKAYCIMDMLQKLQEPVSNTLLKNSMQKGFLR